MEDHSAFPWAWPSDKVALENEPVYTLPTHTPLTGSPGTAMESPSLHEEVSAVRCSRTPGAQ